jgi:hypothetical protein
MAKGRTTGAGPNESRAEINLTKENLKGQNRPAYRPQRLMVVRIHGYRERIAWKCSHARAACDL